MNRGQQLVCQAIGGIVAFMVAMNLIYFFVPGWSLTLAEWNMLAISSITSFFGVYYALYLVWKYHRVVDDAKQEIDRKLRDRYGVLFDLLRRLDEKFEALPPERKERILRRGEEMVDRLLERMSET